MIAVALAGDTLGWLQATQRHDAGTDATMTDTQCLPLLGWSEWALLPQLGPGRVLAKVDTGARSCSLHVEVSQCGVIDGIEQVAFRLRTGVRGPLQECCLPVADRRLVTNSGGQRRERIFIRTRLRLGDWEREVEVSLADRQGLRHPMLIGRTAIAGAWQVDPGRRFVLGGQESRP